MSKIIISVLVFIALIFGIVNLTSFLYRKGEMEKKLTDIEIRNWKVINKVRDERTESYSGNCYLSNNFTDIFKGIQVNAKARGGARTSPSKPATKPSTKTSPTKSNVKPDTPDPPPTKPTKQTKIKIDLPDVIENPDGTKTYNRRIAPDDDENNPQKGIAPDDKTWKCMTLYRQVCDYYITTSSDKDKKIYYQEGQRPCQSNITNEKQKLWEEIQVGSPVAEQAEYKNYIKASDTTILKRKAFLNEYKYKNLVPEEPKVYDVIKINQCLQIRPEEENTFDKISDSDLQHCNQELMRLNGELGASKQLNTLTLFVPDYMSDFIYALDEKWIGSNKNELVIIVNLDRDSNIVRVQTLSWSKRNSEIQTKLDTRSVEEIKTIKNSQDIDKFLTLSKETLNTLFERTEMQEFEYLEKEIKSKYGFD